MLKLIPKNGKYEISLSDLQKCKVKLPAFTPEINIIKLLNTDEIGFIETPVQLKNCNFVEVMEKVQHTTFKQADPMPVEKQQALRFISKLMKIDCPNPEITAIRFKCVQILQDGLEAGELRVPVLPKFLWKILTHADDVLRALFKPANIRMISNEDMRFCVLNLSSIVITSLYKLHPDLDVYPLLSKEEGKLGRLDRSYVCQLDMWPGELVKFKNQILNKRALGSKEIEPFEDSVKWHLRKHKDCDEISNKIEALYTIDVTVIEDPFKEIRRRIAIVDETIASKKIIIDSEPLPHAPIIARCIKELHLSRKSERSFIKLTRNINVPGRLYVLNAIALKFGLRAGFHKAIKSNISWKEVLSEQYSVLKQNREYDETRRWPPPPLHSGV